MSPSILIFHPLVQVNFAEMLDTKPFNLLQIKCEEKKENVFTPESKNSSNDIPGECNSSI